MSSSDESVSFWKKGGSTGEQNLAGGYGIKLTTGVFRALTIHGIRAEPGSGIAIGSIEPYLGVALAGAVGLARRSGHQRRNRAKRPGTTAGSPMVARYRGISFLRP